MKVTTFLSLILICSITLSSISQAREWIVDGKVLDADFVTFEDNLVYLRQDDKIITISPKNLLNHDIRWYREYLKERNREIEDTSKRYIKQYRINRARQREQERENEQRINRASFRRDLFIQRWQFDRFFFGRR